MPDFGLGRRYSPDARDRQYLARELVPEVADRSKYWAAFPALDQGSTPMCVAYSLTTLLMAGPMMHKTLPVVIPPVTLYHAAQDNDEWDGNDYEGTSVRGGCKALQNWGLITEYRWAMTAADVAAALVHHAPVVIGSNWLEDMFEPDAESGLLHVSGAVAGGHAYCLIGYNLKSGLFRVLNSWGTSWGQKGRAWLKGEDLDRLLSDQGEAAVVVEAARTPFDAAEKTAAGSAR